MSLKAPLALLISTIALAFPQATLPQAAAQAERDFITSRPGLHARERMLEALPPAPESVRSSGWPRRPERRSHDVNSGSQSWSDEFKRPGFDNRVFALTTYHGALVAGGDFTVADSASVGHVARWDGAAWQGLGSGVSDGPETYRSVAALHPYGDDLIVGGTFRTAGGQAANCIARWDDVTWQAMGSGMTLSGQPGNDVPSVRCLIEFEGNLVAGGLFDRVDGIPSPAIARWNGQSWAPFGSTPIREVFALLVHDGTLFIACDGARIGAEFFSGVLRWDGGNWTPVGTPFIGPVLALEVYEGDLIAGAAFGAPNVGPASHLARWDGANWQAIGGGLSSRDPWYFGVHALAVHDGLLVVGGEFTSAGETPVASIAAWDGATWSSLGSGMHLPTFGPVVRALHVHQGALVAGGDFSRAGGASADFVARWENDTWSGLGPTGLGFDGLVVDFLVHNEQLFAAGNFQQAGSIDATHVARWNDGWLPMGQGLRRDSTSVYALTVFDGHPHAAVTTVSGDSSVSFLARWTGSEWLQISPRTNSYISCIVEYAGDLVAGGWFTHAGDVAASAIARWDGSQWRTLGAGMSGQYRPEVRALQVFQGVLFAAGSFDRAGDVDAANVASWNGTGWASLDGGLTGSIYANAYDLATYGDQLVAVGDFDHAGEVAANSVAGWDGANWHALGDGPQGDWDLPAFVLSVATSGEQLVVSGLFDRVGGSAARNIAQWDGTTWKPLGSGLDEVANTLAFLGGDLWAGGWFRSAGGKQSAHIARWTDSIVPVGLHDFVALEQDDNVLLRWTVAEPTDLRQIDVQRAVAELGPWTTISSPPLAPEPAMSFVDPYSNATATSWYRLRVQAANGELSFVGPIVYEPRTARRVLRLPPPIVPIDGGPVRVRYELNRTVRVELTVFDVRGHLVRRLDQGIRTPGEHDTNWDRTTARGTPVPRGVYLLKLRAGNSAVSCKFVCAS